MGNRDLESTCTHHTWSCNREEENMKKAEKESNLADGTSNKFLGFWISELVELLMINYFLVVTEFQTMDQRALLIIRLFLRRI